MAIQPVNYRESIYPSIDGREEVTLQAFFEYGMYIGVQNEPRSICGHAQLLSAIESQADVKSDPTPQDIQDRLWRVVQEQIPSLQNKDTAAIWVENDFLDSVFCPLIPESIVYKLATDEDTTPLIKSSARILLVVEAIFRELASALISLAISAYSMHNPDYATYYQFRLDLNRHHPTEYVITKFVLPLIGSY